MNRTFKEALQHRRSFYALGSEMLTNQQEIEEMIEFTLRYVPSAFNSKSTRIVLLMGNAHRIFWKIVKASIRPNVTEEEYCKSEKKIDLSFASGYGTLLFFEDMNVVKSLQDKYPLYADKFPLWAWQTSAMHQLALWCMLEDTGLGASLQHYNPLIDKAIKQHWTIPESWELNAQMPFGYPPSLPGNKEDVVIEGSLMVYS